MNSPELRPVPDPPWLFDSQGMVVLTGGLLLATFLGSAPVQLLAASLFVMGAVSRVWAHWGMRGLRYERTLEPRTAFAGDTVSLTTRMRNRTPLPISWLEVWERLSHTVVPDAPVEKSLGDPRLRWMNQSAALWPYARARWEHQLRCTHRGVFPLPPVVVRAGDPFGVIEKEETLGDEQELVVYPRVVPLRALRLPLRQALVERPDRRSLAHDPALVAGVRAYQPGDPQRLVHWRVSAHRGSLHVRIPEPSTSMHVTLVVHTGGFSMPSVRYQETLFELALSAAASIAVYLQAQGRPAGMVVDGPRAAALPAGTSDAQLQSMLDHMARLQPVGDPSLSAGLASHLPGGGTVILVVADLVVGLEQAVAELSQARRQVVVLRAGKRGAPLPNLLEIDDGDDLAARLEGRA